MGLTPFSPERKAHGGCVGGELNCVSFEGDLGRGLLRALRIVFGVL